MSRQAKTNKVALYGLHERPNRARVIALDESTKQERHARGVVRNAVYDRQTCA